MPRDHIHPEDPVLSAAQAAAEAAWAWPLVWAKPLAERDLSREAENDDEEDFFDNLPV